MTMVTVQMSVYMFHYVEPNIKRPPNYASLVENYKSRMQQEYITKQNVARKSTKRGHFYLPFLSLMFA